MLASEIISRILKRHEALCAKYPQLVDFLPNSKGDSFYLIIDGNDEATPIQIRISSHETNIESWIDEKEWGNKFKRVNPSSYVNISIVFNLTTYAYSLALPSRVCLEMTLIWIFLFVLSVS